MTPVQYVAIACSIVGCALCVIWKRYTVGFLLIVIGLVLGLAIALGDHP